MKDATKLDVYFSGDKTLFIIPLYQRNYAWQKKHCERLFADLVKIKRNNIRSHFFGSIVSVKANEVEDDVLIIDGQQRITTISLLIIAAINSYNKGELVCTKGEEFVNDTRKRYLLAKYRNIPRLLKLRPIENDMKAYDALYEGDEENYVPSDKSDITKNYEIFITLLRQNLLTFDELIEAIERLIVIDIRLDSSDNPQLIFESLNSCGKDLEEADKVRNYLLMSLNAEQQEEYYKAYWRKIEKFTSNEPTMFIRDYLTVKRRIISSLEELYFDFKLYVEEHAIERKDLLADMLKYASYYNQAIYGKTSSEKLNKKFKQLSNIGSSVCMPFYMALLEYAETEGMEEDVIYEVLDVVENYWARRIICSYPSNVMAKIFSMLHSDVLRIISKHERREIPLNATYADLVKHILLNKQGNAKFPTDSMVRESFPSRQIYRIPLDYRCFLFERMENLDSKECDENIAEKIKQGTYTIEHIMPQTLTQHWKDQLGEQWNDIHENYLHTFGNLTLTGYNSNYGNRPFVVKKEGFTDRKGNKVYGFKDTPFKLNNYVKTVDKWTDLEIKERQKILLENFMNLWPMISTCYEPLDKETDSVSFADDEVELTGRKIHLFTYRNISHQVTSWKEMLVQVCKLVYEEEPVKMSMIATSNNAFHLTESPKCSKIADNCYVFSSSSVNTIQSTLRYLFKECEIPEQELIFGLLPLKDTDVDDIEESVETNEVILPSGSSTQEYSIDFGEE